MRETKMKKNKTRSNSETQKPNVIAKITLFVVAFCVFNTRG